jgi:hypothetical protein
VQIATLFQSETDPFEGRFFIKTLETKWILLLLSPWKSFTSW